MKRPALFRRRSAIGLPWAGWAVELLARFGHRSGTTPLALTFFVSARRSQAGATLVQQRNVRQHQWLSPTIQVHLSAIFPDMADRHRTVLAYRPDQQHGVPLPLRTERMLQSHAGRRKRFRQIERSMSRMTVIDVAWRGRFDGAAGLPGQLNDLNWAAPTQQLSARYMAATASQDQIKMAGAAGAAFRRATRVGELPPFAPRMELRRPEQASGALRDPLPSVEAPAWHQPSAGTIILFMFL